MFISVDPVAKTRLAHSAGLPGKIAHSKPGFGGLLEKGGVSQISRDTKQPENQPKNEFQARPRLSGAP